MLVSWLIILLLASPPAWAFRCAVTRRSSAAFSLNLGSSSDDTDLDPLEPLKNTAPAPAARKESKPKTAPATAPAPTSTAPTLAKPTTTPKKKKSARQLLLTEKEREVRVQALLTRCEGSIISSFPAEVFNKFMELLNENVLRLSIMSVALHLMLLFPTIQNIRTFLGPSVDVISFLYLGPLVAAFPFFTLWIWEADKANVPIIDNRLRKYLDVMRRKTVEADESKELQEALMAIFSEQKVLFAVEAYFDRLDEVKAKTEGEVTIVQQLRQQPKSRPQSPFAMSEAAKNNPLVKLPAEEEDEYTKSKRIPEELKLPIEDLCRLSYYRLFAQADMGLLFDEVQALRKIGGGSEEAAPLATSVRFVASRSGSGSGSSEPPPGLIGGKKKENKLFGNNNDEQQRPDYNSAVSQLLEGAATRGETKEDTLALLKQLQKDLAKLAPEQKKESE
jgi:hypothetical protein